MKKLFFFLLFLALHVNVLFASPVSKEKARRAALGFMNASGLRTVTESDINRVLTESWQGMPTSYIFVLNGGGFVITTADDACEPIIGYSPNETYDELQLPAAARFCLDDYNQEVYKIVLNKLSNEATLRSWEETLSGLRTKSLQAVAPMCSTTWNQTNGYNTYCPSGTPTGCVATAMAQVMKKWNYPATGDSSHSYVHGTYGTLSANFGATTYNWSAMSNTSGGTAVATLMYHCGVSVDMDYAPAGSGSYNFSVPPALKTYFRYHPSAEAKSKANFSTETTWLNMIKEEMDAGRPCLLAGDNGTAGHEWVCDGYQGTGTTFYHMNWGWGGSSNGYFRLYQLNPAGSNYSSNRQASIRICPSSAKPIAAFTASTTFPAINQPVDFTDESLQTPTSWYWTFEGGTPATSTAQNPTGITFATNGYHVVTLRATNATGSDTKTRERYIKVGGTNTVWTKQNIGFSSASRAVDQVAIIDANTVWAKAYDATNPTGYIRDISRTTDGGQTWTPGVISFTNSTSYGVANLFPMSAQTCYASMFPVSGNGGLVVKTTDGGITWTTQTSANFTTSWLDFLHFFNANNGVAVGDPVGTDFVIYTTSNGGTSWTQVSAASIPNALTSEAGIVNHYYAIGNTIWFTTNKGRLFKSTDMGQTWTVNTTGFTSVFTPVFRDANVGIAVLDTVPYSLMKTNNGGATWTSLVPTGALVSVPTIGFIPGTPDTWMNVASYPSSGSSISIDGGVSFVNIDTGSVQFTSVAFLDFNTGWAGSLNASATDGGIYKWNPAVLTDAQKSQLSGSAGMRVYPNPSKGIVTLLPGKVPSGAETIQVALFDLLGNKVFAAEEKAISNDILQYDLSAFSKGMYLLQVTCGTNRQSIKVQLTE